MESGLRYTGMTAVEDELQDGLCDTLKFIGAAGVRVWMLTGDKTETAISIAKSAGLTESGSELLLLTKEEIQAGPSLSDEDCLRRLN